MAGWSEVAGKTGLVGRHDPVDGLPRSWRPRLRARALAGLSVRAFRRRRRGPDRRRDARIRHLSVRPRARNCTPEPGASRCTQPGELMTSNTTTSRTAGLPSPRPASPAGRPGRDERAAAGKAARVRAPLDSHAGLDLDPSRDPVGLLLGQAASRVPELVPVRHGRMLVSPFTYYRGAALPMAADLARTPATGLRVQLCGDAHLANFGAFASPERRSRLRPQRLRRDAARPVRVGRETPRREPGRGGSRQRLRTQGPAQGRARRRIFVPDGDAGVRRDADARRLVRASGCRAGDRSRQGPGQQGSDSRRPRHWWPRPTPATARRLWPS